MLGACGLVAKRTYRLAAVVVDEALFLGVVEGAADAANTSGASFHHRRFKVGP